MTGKTWFLRGLAIAQIVAAIRVFARMVRSAHGQRVQRVHTAPELAGQVTVLIPVLNEVTRLAPCLEGAIAQGPEVSEILVVDGGSTDGTHGLVRRFADLDSRLRLIDTQPVPSGVNGKAYGLQVGFDASAATSSWILTLDADVRPDPLLARSMVVHARQTGVDALSVATQQQLSGAAEGLLHPSMLATLVYRFGIPGTATQRLDRIQANGQCFLLRREILVKIGGFGGALHSINEDVTTARMIAAAGHAVGFHESDQLITVTMYSGWRDAWENWTRSLPMQDRFVPNVAPQLLEIALVQALPPWFLAAVWRMPRRTQPLTMLNLALLIARLGVLAGMKRAYTQSPWTYWISPLCDVPVVWRIWMMSRRRQHLWRGRIVEVRGN